MQFITSPPRGNAQQAIYQHNRDRCEFQSVLEKACNRYQWQVYAYCLMDNHYHLLVLGSVDFVIKALSHLPKEQQMHLSEIPKKPGRKVYALSTYFKRHDKVMAVV